MIATLISHPSCLEHHMPPGHPECPARIEAIINQLMASGIDSLLYQRWKVVMIYWGSGAALLHTSNIGKVITNKHYLLQCKLHIN